MTIENFVFCNKESLPTRGELQDTIGKIGFDLEIVGRFNPLSDHAEFVECLFENEFESGFDVWSEPLVHDDFDLSKEQWAKVGGRDNLLVTSTFSNAQEIMGALIATAAIVRFTGGLWLDDFYEGALITSDEVVGWIETKMPDTRAQFSGPSKIRERRRQHGL